MEFKPESGDRFENAFNQAASDLHDTMDGDINVYVVIQRGTKIRIFVYHDDITPESSPSDHVHRTEMKRIPLLL